VHCYFEIIKRGRISIFYISQFNVKCEVLAPETFSTTVEKEGANGEETSLTPNQLEVKKKVTLKFRIPKGCVSDIMGVMNLLQSKFNSLEIEINAEDGEITEQDY
jgi:hypothetical protein